MLVATSQLLDDARQGGYALGAFNVYNMEQALAVARTADALASPLILQILPKAVQLSGSALVALCLDIARRVSVPAAVHLDHCASAEIIEAALSHGMSSVMADGSQLSYEENLRFTREMAHLAGAKGALVEGELGRLSGSEEGWAVASHLSQLTDPEQAAEFVAHTGVGALAVCIGNVHGRYRGEPVLDLDRLADIAKRVAIPIVLHGTSGLPDGMIRRSIALGVCKFNVNTELRNAYLRSAQAYFEENAEPELTSLMHAVIQGLAEPVTAKLRLFGSIGEAK
jgi:tagatose 1,6-diphosphate aldolase GatY/KbaY